MRADTRVFGQVPASESINLDQLWLKFDVLQFAYLTVGQQPIRWGSSRFWNPTDVMNNQIRDPLAVFDERLGVNLVKVHIPVESLGWNFYLVANMDGAADFQDVGGAARAEFLIEQTEIALTAAYRDQRPLTLGFDISSALWLFDVRAEVAVLYDMQAPFWAGQFVIDPATFAFETPRSRSRADDWILQGVVGADISIPYNDENDALILGGEYFYNDAGYKTSNLYTWLALQGQFNPLYVGRHYVAAYATMFAPGHWDDTSFILSWLANLSDGSHVIRFDAAVTFFTRLTFNVFTNVYLGNEMGSFRNGRAPQFDIIDVNTVSPELLAGFGQSRETLLGFQRGQPAALFDAGVGLRIQY